MSKWLISLMWLVMTAAGAEDAWTWVDENGTRHYSDRPVAGATKIQLGPAQGVTSNRPAPPRTAAPQTADEQPAPERYRVFDVASPEQQETLWNIEGNLSVRLDIRPALQAGNTVDVFLDGERKNVKATSSQFVVPDVYRGMHTLQAVVVDSNGNELARSPAVTFMVRQTSIIQPAGG
jgi:hypothetical protein